MRQLLRVIGTVLVCLIVNAHLSRAQSANGTIEGRVLDGVTGEPLPGATLLLTGTSLATATDRAGVFRLSGAPSGEQTLVITYLGKADRQVTVMVKASAVTVAEDIRLERIA